MPEHDGNPTERPPEAGKEAVDFSDIDALDGALAGDDQALLASASEYLRSTGGFADEEIAGAVANQRERAAVHEAMKSDLAARLQSGRAPTAEELAMGAFAESIEPPVRDAVLAMRRKGYGTASSGFNSLDWQTIVFSSPITDMLGDDARRRLEEAGFEVKEKSIGFKVKAGDVPNLKATWDKLAEMLPDLGRPAPETAHGQAKSFRLKYGEKGE